MCNCNNPSGTAFNSCGCDDLTDVGLLPAFAEPDPCSNGGGSSTSTTGGVTEEYVTNALNQRSVRTIITASPQWSNAYTYNDSSIAGITFRVMYNNGNRFLDAPRDGWAVLPGGGFVVDPTLFQLQDGEELLMIF